MDPFQFVCSTQICPRDTVQYFHRSTDTGYQWKALQHSRKRATFPSLSYWTKSSLHSGNQSTHGIAQKHDENLVHLPEKYLQTLQNINIILPRPKIQLLGIKVPFFPGLSLLSLGPPVNSKLNRDRLILEAWIWSWAQLSLHFLSGRISPMLKLYGQKSPAKIHSYNRAPKSTFEKYLLLCGSIDYFTDLKGVF